MARRMTRAFITGQPVVADRHRARRFHGADGRQFLARAPLGDGADGKHVDQRLAARPLHDVAGHHGAIVHRLGVRHAADGGEPARRRRPRPALDGLGVLETRLAQMHVHVDEARRHDHPRGVEHLRLRRGEIRRDARDPPVHNQHVRHAVRVRRRVDHPSVPDHDRHAIQSPFPAPPCAPRFRSPPGSGSPTAGNPPPRWKVRARD